MAESLTQKQLLDSQATPAKNGRRAPSKRANGLNGSTWLRYSVSVWDDIRKTPEEMALKHPAMFPAELAMRLIQCFTTDEDSVVLDPFVGVGSTVIAAESLGKVGIGLDVSEDYIAKAMARPTPARDLLQQDNQDGVGERRLYLCDANELLSYVDHESVDMVVTSPPYWDILLQERSADYKAARNYGSSTQDLGKIRDYSAFLRALGSIFANVYETLKPNKYCCVIVMDLRKKDRFYPFHADLATALQEVGFIFDDTIIWHRGQEYNNLRPLGYPSVFRINKVHEFIMIFKKPGR